MFFSQFLVLACAVVQMDFTQTPLFVLFAVLHAQFAKIQHQCVFNVQVDTTKGRQGVRILAAKDIMPILFKVSAKNVRRTAIHVSQAHYA